MESCTKNTRPALSSIWQAQRASPGVVYQELLFVYAGKSHLGLQSHLIYPFNSKHLSDRKAP